MKKSVFYIITALILAALSAGCRNPAAPTTTPPGPSTYKITGTVIGEGENGAAIPNAIVKLYNIDDDTEKQEQTNESGEYAFSGMTANKRYRITADRKGFKPAISSDFLLESHHSVPELVLDEILDAIYGNISIKSTDEQVDLTKATVELWQKSGKYKDPDNPVSAEGYYIFSDVSYTEEDDYELKVNLADYELTEVSSAFALASGSVCKDIELKRLRHDISGTITAEGIDFSAVTVAVELYRDNHADPIHTATVDQNGKYTFEKIAQVSAAPEYELKAKLLDHEQKTSSAKFDLTAPKANANIELQRKVWKIVGTITTDIAPNDYSAIAVKLYRNSESEPFKTVSPQKTGDTTYPFTFTDIPQISGTEYRVEAEHNDYTKGSTLENFYLYAQIDDADIQLNIKRHNIGGKISGFVDTADYGNVTVTLYGKANTSITSTSPDANGNYSFTNVPQISGAEYLVKAEHTDYNTQQSAAKFSLTANKSENLALSPISYAINGAVETDSNDVNNDLRVVKLTLYRYDSGTSGFVEQKKTDAAQDGSWSFSNVPQRSASAYKVKAELADHEQKTLLANFPLTSQKDGADITLQRIVWKIVGTITTDIAPDNYNNITVKLYRNSESEPLKTVSPQKTGDTTYPFTFVDIPQTSGAQYRVEAEHDDYTKGILATFSLTAQKTDANITLNIKRHNIGGKISGFVDTADYSGVTVTLYGKNSVKTGESVNPDANGNYSFTNVPQISGAEYLVKAEHTDYNTQQSAAKFSLTANKSENLVLSPILYNITNGAVETDSVNVNTDRRVVKLTLYRYDSGTSGFVEQQKTDAAQDGSWSFTDVPKRSANGAYKIKAELTGIRAGLSSTQESDRFALTGTQNAPAIPKLASLLPKPVEAAFLSPSELHIKFSGPVQIAANNSTDFQFTFYNTNAEKRANPLTASSISASMDKRDVIITTRSLDNDDTDIELTYTGLANVLKEEGTGRPLDVFSKPAAPISPETPLKTWAVVISNMNMGGDLGVSGVLTIVWGKSVNISTVEVGQWELSGNDISITQAINSHLLVFFRLNRTVTPGETMTLTYNSNTQSGPVKDIYGKELEFTSMEIMVPQQ